MVKNINKHGIEIDLSTHIINPAENHDMYERLAILVRKLSEKYEDKLQKVG